MKALPTPRYVSLTDADGKGLSIAMKPTKFMTSSQVMAEGLDRRCDRSHKHQHLEGGRAAEAAFYPLPLIRAILKGIRATSDLEHATRDNQVEQMSFISDLANHQGTVPVEPQADVPHSCVSRTNGGKVRVDDHDSNFKLRYLDEYTGEVLDPVLIRAAIWRN